jgi:hypothetical protein
MPKLTEQELHYLRSILRNLREFREVCDPLIDNVSWLGCQVLADNIDWLDCFIDEHERKLAASV